MELAHGLRLNGLNLKERIRREVDVELGVKHHAPHRSNRSLTKEGHILLASLVHEVGRSGQQGRSVDETDVILS